MSFLVTTKTMRREKEKLFWFQPKSKKRKPTWYHKKTPSWYQRQRKTFLLSDTNKTFFEKEKTPNVISEKTPSWYQKQRKPFLLTQTKLFLTSAKKRKPNLISKRKPIEKTPSWYQKHRKTFLLSDANKTFLFSAKKENPSWITCIRRTKNYFDQKQRKTFLLSDANKNFYDFSKTDLKEKPIVTSDQSLQHTREEVCWFQWKEKPLWY